MPHARRVVGNVGLVPVAMGLDRGALGQLLLWQSVDGADPGWLDAVADRFARTTPTPLDAGYLALHRAWIRWVWAGAPPRPGEPFNLKDIYQPPDAALAHAPQANQPAAGRRAGWRMLVVQVRRRRLQRGPRSCVTRRTR